MKKYLPIIAALALVKLGIHLVGNRNYGFHRDELLHLSVSQHLAFGYMEFPPFIAWIGKLAYLIFGCSVSGVRFFSTLAGLVILVVCCLMAKEFGGKAKAVFLAGIAVLAFLPFYRNHMLFQPVGFDQMFWTLGFYLLLKYINTQNNKFLIYLGITAGFGLMNKYTFLVLGIGIAVGLLFYENARLYKSKWLYLSVLIAFLIFLPNIIWQFEHHFPALLHLQKLKESQLDEMGPYDFILDQVKLPFTFVFSVIGLILLLFSNHFKNYKVFGIATIVIFVTMWLMQSKGYYFYAIYPVLFAAASVQTERFFRNKPVWNYAVAFVLFFPVFFYLPKDIPVLSIENHVRYLNLKPDANGHVKLTDDYADMFGWDEQVKLTDSIYKSLPEAQRNDCMVIAENYGEAGAIEILGKQYGLPDPVCKSGSFWLWGAGNKSGNLAITIGLEKEVVHYLFSECQLVKTIKHRYAIDEENNIPVYICCKPKVNIKKIWPTLEKQVFD